jgi:CheY-like chemotaxis protein
MDDTRLILHIEDESEIVELVTEILRHPQVTLMGAPDGATGLTLASEHRPDLILLDIMLPGMDGWEVFVRLRASPETADIPVVMLTVKNMPYDVARGSLVDRLEGYIQKPFDIWELRKEIGANLGIKY